MRRRRPRLVARCEGGADGEEEGAGRGPAAAKSRAVARTITMATEKGGTLPVFRLFQDLETGPSVAQEGRHYGLQAPVAPALGSQYGAPQPTFLFAGSSGVVLLPKKS